MVRIVNFHHHQQDVFEYPRVENQLLKEKLGKCNIPLAGRRILLSEAQRRRRANERHVSLTPSNRGA